MAVDDPDYSADRWGKRWQMRGMASVFNVKTIGCMRSSKEAPSATNVPQREVLHWGSAPINRLCLRDPPGRGKNDGFWQHVL